MTSAPTIEEYREALKPCPFCGGDAERLDFETVGTALGGDPNAGGSCITCKRCGASSPIHFDRKENLVSSWNDRRRTPVKPTERDAFEAWAHQDNRRLEALEFEEREPDNFHYYEDDSTNQAYIGWCARALLRATKPAGEEAGPVALSPMRERARLDMSEIGFLLKSDQETVDAIRQEAVDRATAPERLVRDIFCEITAKAKPLKSDPIDPERIMSYEVPCGPIHRAAGKLGYQMFDGEQHLANAVAEIRRLKEQLAAQPAQAVDAIAMPTKLSPEVVAACVGGGITSAQIEHIYSLVYAAVSLYQAQPAQAVDREAVIKHMVDRFLGWKLPEHFNPDAGISFKAAFNEHTDHPMKHEPSGTNLFDAVQATAMVRFMVEGLPVQTVDREALLELLCRIRDRSNVTTFIMSYEDAADAILSLLDGGQQ